MACQYFGPYDPQNDPQDTLEKWVKSCPSSGGSYPRACLLGKGTYLLYCCTDPSDNPCTKLEGGVVICLAGETALELDRVGEVHLFGGKALLRHSRKHT